MKFFFSAWPLPCSSIKKNVFLILDNVESLTDDKDDTVWGPYPHWILAKWEIKVDK